MKLQYRITGLVFLLLAGLYGPVTAFPLEMAETDTLITPTFENTIEQLGLSRNAIDYSNEKKIKIDKPSCAYTNITGTDMMPKSKTVGLNVFMDIYTDNGDHFLKRAIISAQGNSSLSFPKKNFKADFCEDEWQGEETTGITIGDWVKQDGFHFKSYYIDYLRGIGVVGYQLYDQIARYSGRPWTRALSSIASPRENARCYPDGFPCIVYLNGYFYGIFAWQLKKHRDNMNQTKTEAMHVHLDGELGENSFWWPDSIVWTEFEVRNPKSLYTMKGQQYDSDRPEELIDETSEFFFSDTDDESTREAKKRTAQTKHYIETLHQVYSHIDSLRMTQGNPADICTRIEEHFDLTSLIDYACFHLAVNNNDGFRKNWQWFTYDGTKWFVAPYDLDCIFGNWHTGNFTIPADKTWPSGGHAWDIPPYGPFAWVTTYFADRVENRYKELRYADIIDGENICRLLDNWYLAVSDYYETEWQRWPDSKCISTTVVSDGWQQIYTDYDKPLWNDSTVYAPGDRCTLDNLAWEATDTVYGVKPYIQLGYHDSLERYKEWIRSRISILDERYGYQSTDDDIENISKPSAVISVHDAAGRKVSVPARGLNIFRYGDGSTRKVLR